MNRLVNLGPVLALSILSLVGCEPDENPTQPSTTEEIAAPSFATAANTWTTRASMGVPRAAHKTATVNGIIYAIGGNGFAPNAGRHQIRPTVEAYNPATNTWTLKKSLPEPLEPTGATMIAGKIYVAGGLSNERISIRLYVYDPATNLWTRKADMPYKGPIYGGLQGTINGQLYVYHGMTTNPDGSVGPQRFVRYNPATNTWASLKVPSFARVGGASASLNGRMYIMGGKLPTSSGGTTGQAADVHVYNPSTGGWSKLTGLRGGWAGHYTTRAHAYATTGGKLYITGSDFADGWEHVNVVYDPATNTAAEFAAPHYARSGAAGGAANGKFYAIGGKTCEDVSGQDPCQPSGLSGAVEEYTP